MVLIVPIKFFRIYRGHNIDTEIIDIGIIFRILQNSSAGVHKGAKVGGRGRVLEYARGKGAGV